MKAIQKVTEEVGTLFGCPNELNVEVAQLLAKDYDIPYWRFMNSGTEATRDAIHIARAFTGHDHIIKMEFGYHGHHESVMVSINPSPQQMGTEAKPISVPSQPGLPKAITDLAIIIPFNCEISLLEKRIQEFHGKIACIILEPILMNCTIILPRKNFLEEIRKLCDQYKIILIFDEVKTNTTVGKGGATKFYGVKPDIIALAKSVGGGTPVAALGMREDIAERIEQGEPTLVGTFNGSPLCMAAVKSTLTEVMTEENYKHVNQLNHLLKEKCTQVIEEFKVPAHVVTIGAKGCLTFTTNPVENVRKFREEAKFELTELLWLYLNNNGVWMTPGVDDEWTISVLHTEEDITKFAMSFKNMITDLTKGIKR